VASGNSKLAWKVTSGVTTTVAVLVAHRVSIAAWKWFTGDEPPEHPLRPGTSVGEAATWVALSGASVGLARLASVRFAASRWVRATGALPRGAEDVEVRL
jgi:hypothetical protein